MELRSDVVLDPGGVTVVRLPVPAAAIVGSTLDLAIERRTGPDAAVSELRLFSSRPVPPTITVVGDSRGGLIGTVSNANFAGVADVPVSVTWSGGATRAVTDANGLFRVPARDLGSLARATRIGVTATAAGLAATAQVDSTQLARGLTELPVREDRLDLAGDWQFAPGRTPGPGAMATGVAHVPGHVAFDGLVGDAGVATLWREIVLPAAWDGRSVFARFDGAYGRAEIFVNGHAAGTHSAGATSFDVDLTPHLTRGPNVLAVVLTEYTPHAVLDYMSWYAHTSLLGIWREAHLFSVPKVHLGPVDLQVDWSADRRHGEIVLAADIVNTDTQSRPYSLQLSVSDNGRLLHRTTLTGELGASGIARRQSLLVVPDVDPWSAEIPRLYDFDMALELADGQVARYHRRVGFRHVEVKGRQLLVNGAPIRLIGVNRHDARMRSGRSMRTEDLRHDVLALRQANVNIIRTAHYPADPRLLEICDELGMYVQDQMPICFAAGFDDHHWTRTNDAAHLVPFVLEVTAETIARDKPHPSVIIWDLANETQWAWGFDAQLALVREMDPGRPTIFSFDLNQLGPTNPLPHMAPQDRPDIRTYHYPGWDRSWQEDIDWLGSYDQPVVLDECNPPFQDNARAPLHAEILALDPGFRDYWVVGSKPFMDRAMRDTGCIGGMIWSAVDDQWTLPIDETVGQGHWAHLTKLDYHRVRDVHPPQDGRVFRGEGEWGLLDGWGRPRPELWHVHKLYSPIQLVSAEFSSDGATLRLSVRNRHSHRDLRTLELQVRGATTLARHLAGEPGTIAEMTLTVAPAMSRVELEFRHPEGWLVDAFGWDVPGRSSDEVIADLYAGAATPTLSLGSSGELTIATAELGEWLGAWPQLHLQSADGPQQPVPLPTIDRARAAVSADGSITVPLTGNGWEGQLTARLDGPGVGFDYSCEYRGDTAFNAREIGLALELPQRLSDAWWHRVADWSAYPEGHIGRPRGYARSAPAPANPLKPAGRWEDDTTEHGINDYRASRRSILAGGATDGKSAISLLSDGSQHLRMTVVNGRPVMHALDWYGGVPFRNDTDHIWTATFGTGKRIDYRTTLQGKIVLTAGALPAAALGKV